jgi:2Fe-2S ferredoxin
MNPTTVHDIQKRGTESADQVHKVTFLPLNKTVEARAGMSLLDIALENAIDLEHNCGGNCACSTCHVIIVRGKESLTLKGLEEEDQLEDADGLTVNSRLACQAKVHGDVVVEIPLL